ncbi:MAG: hypothetical protein ABH986_03975 [archaeon]
MKYSFIFFPGMIFHEFSHLVACLLFGVKVMKVKFLGLNEAYVVHEQPNALKSIMITVAPFILGNLVALSFFSYAFTLLFFSNALGFVFLWLGLSVVYYCFPSDQDAKNTFNSFKDFYSKNLVKRNLFVKLILIVSIPFVFIPLFVLLGLMMLFNQSYKLRLLWILFVFVIAFNEPYAFELVNLVGYFIENTATFLFN